MRNLLKAGLRRLSAAPTVAARYSPGDRTATVIAVAARKGGVGKTTTSVNLAAGIARYQGKKVLLLDLDPQGHVATALKSLVTEGGTTLSTILLDDSGSEVLDALLPTAVPNLYVTSIDNSLSQTEEILATRIGKETLLREALTVTRTHFDVIIIDCPPNLGTLSLNGLVAADHVLIPCDPSPLALKGVTSLVDTISTIARRLNPTLDLLGVLLTRVDGRNVTVNDAIVQEIEDLYGTALIPIRIGVSTDLSKAQMEGQDIFTQNEQSRGAQQYRSLAGWVTEQLFPATIE